MNYGFVKVAAAVPHVKVADCKFNVEKIESLIAVAEGKGVQIIIFPEMSITGYTCGDLFGQQLLLEEAEMGLMQILNNTRQLDIISIVGMPVVVNATVINAAVVIQKGKVLGVAAKTYLPKIMERADTLKLPADERALFDVATELEQIALNDDYFVSRHLYPNVDFYTGLIYRAIGFDPSMFTTLFALGRIPGWIAQYREMLADPNTKIGRPRQVYTGYTERDYVPMDQRH